MKKALFTVAILLLMASIKAHGATPWLCTLTFNATAQGQQFIVGNYAVDGTGELSCLNPIIPLPIKEVLPVKISLKSQPIAAEIAYGELALKGQAINIVLWADSPTSLLGKYYAINTQASLFYGAGGFIAVHAAFPDIAIYIAVDYSQGLGFSLGFGEMEISAN